MGLKMKDKLWDVNKPFIVLVLSKNITKILSLYFNNLATDVIISGVR